MITFFQRLFPALARVPFCRFHFCYRTTIKDRDGRTYFYIGKHSTRKLNDRYVGSGNWIKYYKKQQKRYPGIRIRMNILSFHLTSAAAYRHEARLIRRLKHKKGNLNLT